MSIDIVIPSLGESITEVRLGRWLCEDGDWVDRDTPLVEIESDKVTQELPAPDSGRLSITQPEGADLPIGAEIGSIDTSAARPVPSETPVAPHTPAESTSDIPATRVEVATETAAACLIPLLDYFPGPLCEQLAAWQQTRYESRAWRHTRLCHPRRRSIKCAPPTLCSRSHL